MATTARTAKEKRSSGARGGARGNAGRRRPLTRERIVEAALALADDRGDFSMRALGQRLRVDPMAIYRHFRDKEAVLDAMVDVTLAELHAPDPGLGGPRERLRRMCCDFRAVVAEHPGVAVRVNSTRPTLGPHSLELTEACLGLLRELGLPATDAPRAFQLLVRFITGVAAAEERVRAAGMSEEAWKEEMRSAYASLPPERYPQVAAMAGVVAGFGFQEEFEYGLDLLLEALVRRGRAGA